MRKPLSLQARLGISLGLLLTLLWIAAASVTALLLRQEIDEVFDSALQETAAAPAAARRHGHRRPRG